MSLLGTLGLLFLVSSVLGSDHDLNVRRTKSSGTKAELLKDFKQRRAFLKNKL